VAPINQERMRMRMRARAMMRCFETGSGMANPSQQH
jgi:hypothetical protein